VARISDASKERVRDAVDFAELVGAKTELRRASSTRLEGLCPFHDERTPSFGIDPVQKVYHCFGCGEGGDLFKFVQETEGVTFPEAIELLADRYGIELEREEEDPREAERRRRHDELFALLERTAAFYVRYLWGSDEAAPAREYLLGRGLEEEVLRRFRVGFAPGAGDVVLRRSGARPEALAAVGLAARGRDLFRGRITFPLCDPRGRVRGFGARQLGEGRGPKYLNTPENDVFHKRRQLYGADLARAPAAKAGRVIVAEGYTDVIALHQAGLANTVAVMGTSLTEEQVGELGRLAPTVLLALDADAAGHAAMLRAAKVAEGRKLELRVVRLPPGQDPADLVRSEGADGLRARVEASVPFVRFRVERALANGDLASAEGKDAVLDELRPVITHVAPGKLRDSLIEQIVEKLDLTVAQVQAYLTEAPVQRTADAVVRGREPAESRSPAELGERAFLALCIALPGPGAEALAATTDDHFTSRRTRWAAQHLREHLRDPLTGLEDDSPRQAFMRRLVVEAAEDAHPTVLELQALRLEQRRLEREIAGSLSHGDKDLLSRREALRVRIDDAMERAMASGR